MLTVYIKDCSYSWQMFEVSPVSSHEVHSHQRHWTIASSWHAAADQTTQQSGATRSATSSMDER